MCKNKHTLKCSKCGTSFDCLEGNFYSSERGVEGYMKKCKTCFKEEQKERNRIRRLKNKCGVRYKVEDEKEGNSEFIEISSNELELKYEKVLLENEELKEMIEWQKKAIFKLIDERKGKGGIIKV